MNSDVQRPQPSDEDLLRLVTERDKSALMALYDRHAQILHNVIARIVREPTIAEEILQETFWQVWQKASEFHGKGPAAAWIHRIARNKSLDQLRRQKVRPQPLAHIETTVDTEIEMASTAVHTSPEQSAERTWRREHVQKALADIPVEQRQCLLLAYFEGLTQREIADHIHVPVNTVKTRIRLGLEKLGRVLRAGGFAAEDVDS